MLGHTVPMEVAVEIVLAVAQGRLQIVVIRVVVMEAVAVIVLVVAQGLQQVVSKRLV